MAHLILVRGLPGSGKSTFAKLFGYNHFEADQCFIVADGSYNFRPEYLKQAHAWCQNMTFKALDTGQDTVVSNTFTAMWEMEPYIRYAREKGHTLTVVKCEGNYGSIHSVPAEAIDRMRDRWQDFSS